MVLLCLGKNPAVRHYIFRFLGAMAGYTILTIGVALVFYRFHPQGPMAYVLSVLPAIPIVAGVGAVGVYLKEEKDEFQRMVFVQCLLWGLGALLVLTSAWGLLQSFTHVPRFQPMWVFPLYCAFFGMAVPFVIRSYR